MKAFYADHYVLPLPTGHRFPMEKYGKLRNLVSQLDGIELEDAPAVTDTQILYAHDPAYLIKVLQGTLTAKEQQEIGFPWSMQMVERSRRSAGAIMPIVIKAVDFASLMILQLQQEQSRGRLTLD